jgi:glucose/arabinose dehydrogenase
MAFYPSGNDPQYLYVADALKVVRFAYRRGDVTAGPAEIVVPGLVKTVGGHSTRTLVFTADNRHMLVSIGASTNVANSMPKTPPQPLADWEAAHGTGAAWGDEFERAAVLQFDLDGSHRTVFATGLRNCAGMAIAPVTGPPLHQQRTRLYR